MAQIFKIYILVLNLPCLKICLNSFFDSGRSCTLHRLHPQKAAYCAVYRGYFCCWTSCCGVNSIVYAVQALVVDVKTSLLLCSVLDRELASTTNC
jgi:hypothetical protein